MADESKLAPIPAIYISNTEDRHFTIRGVRDMTETTSKTEIAVAEARYATPAKEEAKSTGYVVLGVVAIAVMAAGSSLTGWPLAWALGMAVLALGGREVARMLVKRKTLPPLDGS